MDNKFYTSYIETLKDSFPSISVEAADIQNLISPYQIELPTSVLEQAQAVIKTFYQMSRLPEYQNHISAGTGEADNVFISNQNKNASVLMAYDFHYDRNSNKLKLIEINTNASAFLFSYLLYKNFNQASNYLPLLKNSFLEEVQNLDSINAAIIDEDLEQQKMTFEFQMYNQLFAAWGWDSCIIDEKDITAKNGNLFANNDLPLNFIYNRFCDFTFNRQSSLKFREAFLNNSCVFSPNPKEYVLLADKQRLIDLSQPEFMNNLQLSASGQQTINDCLLKTFNVGDFSSAEELWKVRKNYFFKPKNQYGSKASYRGQSISKKVFNSMLEENTTVQEYCPPDKVTFDDNEFKYDLRFFAYKNQLQMTIARLYQGQVTNFKSPLGGISRVFFNN